MSGNDQSQISEPISVDEELEQTPSTQEVLVEDHNFRSTVRIYLVNSWKRVRTVAINTFAAIKAHGWKYTITIFLNIGRILVIQWKTWLFRSALVTGLATFAILGAQWIFLTVTEISSEAAGHAMQAAIAYVGGIVALCTFTISYQQKRNHSQRQQLDSDFHHVLDMFTNQENIIARSSAASQLADKAEQLSPGKPNLLKHSSYPDFRRSAEHLCRALYIEQENLVRESILLSLSRMMDFDRIHDQQLHRILINELAISNRLARENFIDRLAEYFVARGAHAYIKTPMKLRPVLRDVMEVCQKPLMLISVSGLNEFLRGIQFLHAMARHARLRSAGAQKPVEYGNEKLFYFVHRLEQASIMLADSQQLLVLALREIKSIELSRSRKTLEKWLEQNRLNVNECYFGSWSMWDCSFVGTNFSGTTCQRIDFQWTDLRYAEFSEADLRGCDFENAQLQYAKVGSSIADRSNFMSANLSNSDFSGCSLMRCNFKDADLRNTDLWVAKVAGADFTGANLEGAMLYGLDPGYEDEIQATFTSGAWENADLRKYEFDELYENKYPTHELDDKLIEWFKQQEQVSSEIKDDCASND